MYSNFKKFFLLLTVALITCNSIFAEVVNSEKAQIVLKKYLLSKNNNSQIVKLSHPIEMDLTKSNNIQSAITSSDFYIFKIGTKGFAIISADDRAEAILAYSDESNIDFNNLPPQLNWMLDSYKEQIKFIISNNSNPKSESWSNILNNKSNTSAGQVNPLLTTTWNQAPYYNDKCPMDPQTGQRCVTGCVATAMAQVMKFWNYPTKGAGTHSYNHKSIGNISANFGTTSYNWGSMVEDIQGANSSVATLMFHCGVAVDMDYSSQGSGSQGSTLVADALINYFGYGASTRYVDRGNYPTVDWNDLIKTEITQQRPVYYQGAGSNGGHAWVVDGYDNSGLFHINWGWGGMSNGYFALNAMNPPGLGIGGGGGGFNFMQGAVIGIEGGNGAAPGAYTLNVTGAITVNPNPIQYSQPFTVNVNFTNVGSGAFKGHLAAIIFDATGKFVDFADTSIVKSLNPNKTFGVGGITFSCNGSVYAQPGNYVIAFFERSETSAWKQIVGTANVPDYIEVTVVAYDNPISLNSELKVTGGKVYLNTPNTITTSIKNSDASEFKGDLSLHLFTSDGNYVQALDSIMNIQIPANSTKDNLSFNLPALNVALGSYLIVAYDRPSGKSNWSVIKPSTFANPLTVTLDVAPILADRFETNDTKTTPANIRLDLKSDSVSFKNDSLTFHTSTDLDYYQFTSTYIGNKQVEVTITVYDNLNPMGSKPFTIDAGANYTLNGEQSSIYTSKIPTFTMNGTDTILVKCQPMTKGKLGSYGLEVKLKFVSPNYVEETTNKIEVKPNPAKEYITISNSEGLDDLILLDSKGSIVMKINSKGKKEINVNLNNLSNGTYIIQNNSSKTIDKFIISK